ncbi:hypothetical protein [Streptomyces noursei]|uniref:hypothetical protein n=1 Tax=Streptomyces noursei TaxID=1971 RepID=UPI00381E862E
MEHPDGVTPAEHESELCQEWDMSSHGHPTPEPMPGPTPEQQPNGSRRTSSRDWITTLIAGAAVIVSIVSLNQSRDAQNAARQTREHERAANVGFFTQPRLQPPHMYIANRNSFDIKDVTITFGDGSYDVVGVVPACSIWHLVNFSENVNGSNYSLAFPARVNFTDEEDPPGYWGVDEQDRVQHMKEKPSPPTGTNLTTYFAGHVQIQFLNACV